LIRDNFSNGCITFNETAIKSISKQLKITSLSRGALMVGEGIAKWCEAHSSSPEEAENKLSMMVSEKVIRKMKMKGFYDISDSDE